MLGAAALKSGLTYARWVGGNTQFALSKIRSPTFEGGRNKLRMGPLFDARRCKINIRRAIASNASGVSFVHSVLNTSAAAKRHLKEFSIKVY
ncbi:hypothetical protein TNCV_1112011 [Trichonephila clavipes]|uniref:Uncharacterized protein n=1 Tax=Trichonephila clavipes TaxID=2585209 RepID=A0A8X6RHC8_TRICX|nr:hypothetical protein TNCV_1112011 [Trichonephila clavipes]